MPLECMIKYRTFKTLSHNFAELCLSWRRLCLAMMLLAPCHDIARALPLPLSYATLACSYVNGTLPSSTPCIACIWWCLCVHLCSLHSKNLSCLAQVTTIHRLHTEKCWHGTRVVMHMDRVIFILPYSKSMLSWPLSNGYKALLDKLLRQTDMSI